MALELYRRIIYSSLPTDNPRKPMTSKRRINDQGMSADRPIEIEKDDILDRSDFAKQLACDIKAWDASESLVIGLYGGWGSGKTC